MINRQRGVHYSKLVNSPMWLDHLRIPHSLGSESLMGAKSGQALIPESWRPVMADLASAGAELWRVWAKCFLRSTLFLSLRLMIAEEERCHGPGKTGDVSIKDDQSLFPSQYSEDVFRTRLEILCSSRTKVRPCSAWLDLARLGPTWLNI